MATLTPRTIVIRTLSPQQNHMLKRPAPAHTPVPQNFQLQNVKVETLDEGAPPRKRERLTNLSPEERMLRRKLKNRVAAQTARDRKKEKMDHLEESLARLEEENKRLQQQNQTLQSQKSTLAQENERLRERLGVPPAPPAARSIVKRNGPVSTLESAAGTTDTGRRSLHNLAPHRKPDVLYSILKQIQADASSKLVDNNPDSNPAEYDEITVVEETPSPSNTVCLGPSATELESVKELIQFDHIYYKPATTASQPHVELGQVCENTEIHIVTDSELPTISSMDTALPESLAPEEAVMPIHTDTPVMPGPIHTDTPALQSVIDNLLDIDELLDLSNFNWDSMNNFDFESLTDTSEDVAPSVCKSDSQSRQSVHVNITATSTLPDTSGYAVMADASSPLNDSVYGDSSDLGSPVQSEASIDDLWEESFTELFPSLA